MVAPPKATGPISNTTGKSDFLLNRLVVRFLAQPCAPFHKVKCTCDYEAWRIGGGYRIIMLHDDVFLLILRRESQPKPSEATLPH